MAYLRQFFVDFIFSYLIYQIDSVLNVVREFLRCPEAKVFAHSILALIVGMQNAIRLNWK